MTNVQTDSAVPAHHPTRTPPFYDLTPGSEDQMINAFLRAELSGLSPTIKRVLAPYERYIYASPQRGSDEVRCREALGEARGYGRNKWIFNRFPGDVNWFSAQLDIEHCAGLRYLNSKPWRTLAGVARRVATVVEQLEVGPLPDNPAISAAIETMRDQPEALRLDPIVLVSDSLDQVEPSSWRILEGCKRATALACRARRGAEGATPVMLGVSPAMRGWYWW